VLVDLPISVNVFQLAPDILLLLIEQTVKSLLEVIEALLPLQPLQLPIGVVVLLDLEEHLPIGQLLLLREEKLRELLLLLLEKARQLLGLLLVLETQKLFSVLLDRVLLGV
jgi:hypothetical protein